MQQIIKFGIPAIIVALFFIANHFDNGLFSDVIRIFATVGLFQIVVSNYLWNTNNNRMQTMVDQGVVSDDYDSKSFVKSAAVGGMIAFLIFILLYLPNYILIGWVWILSYLIAFIFIQHYLKGYIHQRALTRSLRNEVQTILTNAEKSKHKSNRKRK